MLDSGMLYYPHHYANGLLVTLLVLSGTLFAADQGAPAAAHPRPVRAIEHIAGDLYRYQDNSHFSVFLVTSDGIIVTDPINRDVASWLKGELKQRFDQPVRYLIYSHWHEDHASGGEVFADSATIVAHDLTRAHIMEEKVPTAIPELTFSDQLTLQLGGKSVELTHMGVSHSDDSIAMFFPDENAVYAVDFICVKGLPYQDLPPWAYHYPEWLDSLHKLEAMDFEIMVPGHDGVGTHEDVRLFRHYLEDLETAVAAGIEAGQTLEEIQASVTLPDYSHWALYDEWFKLNIKGMHRFLSE